MAAAHPPLELAEFHQFVGERLHQNGVRLSPEEVLEEWQQLHPDEDLRDQNVRAVRSALRDMEAGDAGIGVEEHMRELREALPRTDRG